LGAFLHVSELAMELVCCHGIAEHIQLSRKRKILKVSGGILVAFDVFHPKAKRHVMRGA
jgi:hypothetical protein